MFVIVMSRLESERCACLDKLNWIVEYLLQARSLGQLQHLIPLSTRSTLEDVTPQLLGAVKQPVLEAYGLVPHETIFCHLVG